MNCIEFRANIDSYLDNDLDDTKTAEFEIHFTACDKCRLELESLDKCSKVLRTILKAETPPHTIKDKVFRELDEDNR
jgi:anti-sigma factor RsiW